MGVSSPFQYTLVESLAVTESLQPYGQTPRGNGGLGGGASFRVLIFTRLAFKTEKQPPPRRSYSGRKIYAHIVSRRSHPSVNGVSEVYSMAKRYANFAT